MALDLILNCTFHSFDHLFAQCPVNIESNAVIIDGIINITGNTANINIIELMGNSVIGGNSHSFTNSYKWNKYKKWQKPIQYETFSYKPRSF